VVGGRKCVCVCVCVWERGRTERGVARREYRGLAVNNSVAERKEGVCRYHWRERIETE